MFYIRKPVKDTVVPLIREASAAELHNYKNRFKYIEPAPDSNNSCTLDDLLFVNINCDLDLDNLRSKI